MPRMTLAGGKGHTLLAERAGALLQFFDTPEACVLRLVCREFQAEVAAYPWEDRETVILGSIGGWRACFPRARSANVRMLARAGLVVRRTPPGGGHMHTFAHRARGKHARQPPMLPRITVSLSSQG